MELLLAGTIALLAIAMIVALIARRLNLPYTVGLVLTGLALSLARVNFGFELTHDFIFDLILPPLLFEAALNLPWPDLRRDLPPVLAMSFVGVALCVAVVALGLVYVLGWPILPALAFGSLVGATDPIAVVALLKETGVKGRLALLIESESLINDGSAALLFGLVLTVIEGGAAITPLAIVAKFVIVAIGGVLAGLLCGGAAIALAGRSDDHLVETALTAVAAYSSFLLAEHFGASGVLATVAAGMTMGNLGVLSARGPSFQFTARGRDFVINFWEFAAFLANSYIFLMIGLALADAPKRFGIGFAFMIVLALAGRAAAVYPLCWPFRNTSWRVPREQQHFLWWAGLRGALALALALSLPVAMPYRNDILFGAFAVVAFSTLVQGLTAGLLLKALGLGGETSPSD
jgi:monovalent cation:H+ antiporter, CPA1 family